MAVSNWLWSWVWKSPLKGKLDDIEIVGKLSADATLGKGTFGVVMRLVDKQATITVYVGKKLREDVLSVGSARRAILDKFPGLSRQLCSIGHKNILQMHGVFFSDSVSFLPSLLYENADQTLENFLEMEVNQPDKLTILQHVANGLEHLHSQKPPILHLNLTAANVFISCYPQLAAKIADAGVTSLMNAGLEDCSRIAPRARGHFPPAEEFSTSNASIDVFCFGVLIDHVLMQKLNLKRVPIFCKGPGGDIVLDNEDFAHNHVYNLKCLETHPLYPTLQRCLMKHSNDRPSAAELKEQMYDQREMILEWNENIQQDARKWIIDSNSLEIMITGKTGSGKSALINGLIGKKVGEEGDRLVPATVRVEPKMMFVERVKVIIWDTPGLQDVTVGEDMYLAEMKQYCSDCHLYIYCVSMLQSRLDGSEIQALKKITEAFGREFWKKVVFVLTFANMVEQLRPHDCDPTEWFVGRVELWHVALSRTLAKTCGVEQEVANGITIIPAGYFRPLRNKPIPWVLPGVDNWFHNFWVTCANAIDHCAFPALIKANRQRLKHTKEITTKQLMTLPIEEQPIPISLLARSGGVALAGTAASVGTGAGIAAAVGSAIGSLIGPVGTAIGAMAGGALGTLVIDPILFSVYMRYKSSGQAAKRLPPASQ